MERAIVQNHLKLYAKQAKDVLDDAINLSLRNTCKNRQNCEQNFKSSTERILKSCEEDALNKVFVKLDEELNLVGDALKKAADRPCASCYNELKSLLRKHGENIRRIAGLEADAEGVVKDLVVDVTRIVETVMKPLSNPARLTILTSLHQGRTSFSELSEKTGMRGGHLIFHLNYLLSAGLIVQDGRKGDYVITPRGVEIVNKLRSL